ncbi:MAG: hypothetical protein SH809_01725 [Rhodothermales bacterium]|nr:hypothetical protein [Rhodothermales bacterium]
MDKHMENIGTIVLATGALGAAAFGIVEALKWTRMVGLIGYSRLVYLLGPIWGTLERAYGSAYEEVLSGQYRGDHRELVRMIRQGVRIGLTADNAPRVAGFLGVVEGADLAQAAARLGDAETMSKEHQLVLGRYELAVDARIESALAMAQSQYAGKMRTLASFIALGIGGGVGIYLSEPFLGLMIGIAAVPLAPIAKDLVSALQAATMALKRPV